VLVLGGVARGAVRAIGEDGAGAVGASGQGHDGAAVSGKGKFTPMMHQRPPSVRSRLAPEEFENLADDFFAAMDRHQVSNTALELRNCAHDIQLPQPDGV
jgi:hypothetical protein